MKEESHRIKVVQFIHGLSLGGAETIVKDYAIYLDKSKFDLTVLCISRCNSPYDKLLRDSGVRVVYVSDSICPWDVSGFIPLLRRKFRVFLQVRRILSEIKPDIIHYHLELSCYVWFSGVSKTTKLFYTQHYPVEQIKASSKLDYLSLKHLARSRNFRAIVLSKEMKNAFDELFGRSDSIVVRNGIDVGRFQNIKKDFSNRIVLGIPCDSILVGHIGRFSPEKNQGFLLDIISYMKKKNPKVHLLLVGDGDGEEKLKEKVVNLGLSEGVTILSKRDDIPFILSALDIVIVPSLFEGLSIVTIEAQVSGVPCLVSDVLPLESSISNLVVRLPLSEGAAVWGETAFQVLNSKASVEYYGLQDWDMAKVIQEVERVYECAVSNT